MTIQGVPARRSGFHKRPFFTVEVDGIDSASFQMMGEISAEFATIEHFEGGAIVADKEPGRLTFTDVELRRGATDDLDMWNWFATIIDPVTKKSLDVVQRDRAGTELQRWTLYDVWVKKFVPAAGGWDNTVDENRIESVTLAYRYFTPGPTPGA